MNGASAANPLIFLIFGASGSGKTTLIQELEAMEPRVSVHTKGTDRKARQYDGDEILSKGKIGPEEYDYIYSSYGHKYGIQKKQIDEALRCGKHHFILCNDIDTIKAIKHDYPEKVRVIFLEFDAPREYFLAIQKTRGGVADDEINLRLEKIKILNQLFVDHPELFDAVIINKFGAPPSKMLAQIRRIIASEELPPHAQSEEIRRALTGIADVVQEIQDRLRGEAKKISGDAIQEDYMFILMALSGDPLLDDTNAAIKRVAERFKLRAERVDDIAHIDQITDKVLGSIRIAEYVIADLTLERPNVYYELGYAHAYGKNVILTARHGTNLHFDIQGYPVILYASGVQLENELTKRLQKLEDERHRQSRKLQ